MFFDNKMLWDDPPSRVPRFGATSSGTMAA